MLVEKIISRQNPLIKRFRRVRTGTERGFVFLEGVRLLEEALRAGVHLESVAFTAAIESQDRGSALMEKLRSVSCRGANVPPQVMQVIADTESPQGIAAIVSRPYLELSEIFDGKPDFIVIADRLQDPGNLGTIIRTAEAAGASALITTRNTVDPFNQKALRASMGSVLRLPLATDVRVKDAVASCHRAGVRIIAARAARANEPREDSTQQPATAYPAAALVEPFALALGGEPEGVSAELSAAAAGFVSIPMADRIESLNVASAAAVILFEAARQRGFKFSKLD